MRIRATPLQAFFSVVVLSALHAGETSRSPVALDPYSVTESRLPTANTGGALILDREFLERSGALRLEDILARVPGNYTGASSGAATVPNGLPSYGTATALASFSGATASLTQTGVAGAGLRGLGAGSTLILIDGRRASLSPMGDAASPTGTGFQDLAAIPLGLVDRVEILADSASAVHGPDAVGGVINIVLKSDYSGGEATASIRGTTHGGGFERQASVSHGYVRGSLSLLVAGTVSDRQSLRAAQRSFSANQDRRNQGGSDFRLRTGSPAVIQSASGGALNGITLPGATVRIALVKPGQNGGTASLANFEPTPALGVQNLRQYNTSASTDLIGALRQTGWHLSTTYRHSPRLQSFLTATRSDRAGETANEPPVTYAGGFGSSGGIVPTTHRLNPFGQDLIVSLVHVEAPARPQIVEFTDDRLTAGLRGQLSAAWRWEAAGSFAREASSSRTFELSDARLAAALADGRFNPFGDPATGPINTSLYRDLMVPAVVVGTSRLVSGDFHVAGPVATLPGGTANLVSGLESARIWRHRSSSQPRADQVPESDQARTTHAFFAELSVPWFGAANAQPGLKRVDLRFAARHERAREYHKTSPRYSLYWSPASWLTLHGTFAAGFRAPALSEFERTLLRGTSTVTDPRLGQRYSVAFVRGSNFQAQPETSQTWRAGLTATPTSIHGLSFRALVNETYHRNKQTVLSEQTLLNFEDRFADRITRGADGRVTAIDATTINAGRIYTRSLDFHLSYTRDFAAAGRWTLRSDAARQLKYLTDLSPGRTPITVSNGEDTLSPSRWSAQGSLWWDRGNWSAGASVQFLDGFGSNLSGPFNDQRTIVASWTTIDLRLGYRFSRGVWHGRGRDLRLQFGLGNITDRAPPFANTVYGYNQSLHSPLGRTYDCSVRLPF